MSRSRLLPSLACAAAVASCAQGHDAAAAARTAGGESVELVERCTPQAADAAAVRVRTGLAYAAPGGDTLRLDLATPDGAGPHPVVLLLHGGGWEGGGREAMHDEMRLFAAHGFAAATASYRLTRAPRHVFPAAVQDVRCAVRWLRARSPELGLDPERVGVYGYSAGAHLASMLGVAAEVRGLDPPEGGASCGAASHAPPTVRAVVSMAGPQDLRVRGPHTDEQERLVTNFLGVFPGDAPAVAALASPIAHVGPDAAPFLLVQGLDDDLVPPDHARRMRDTLRRAGVRATTIELRGVGHALPALDARGRAAVVGCTVLAFFDRWLRGA